MAGKSEDKRSKEFDVKKERAEMPEEERPEAAVRRWRALCGGPRPLCLLPPDPLER